MYPFPLTRHKIRGVHRRLKNLQQWALAFEGNYPKDLNFSSQYWNHKIPVDAGLVESRHTDEKTRHECAQQLINACHNVILARPEKIPYQRVVAVVCIPDLFTSEICIYFDERYYQGHIAPECGEYGSTKVINGRSLCEEWDLDMPQGMSELGVAIDYRKSYDREDWFVGERWYFGEVA